jgi:hypothetical protein
MRRAPMLVGVLLLAACSSPASTASTPSASSTPSSTTASTSTSDASPSTTVTAACNSASAAAAVDVMTDTVSDLYPAVRACASVAEWVAAANGNPGAISAGVDPREFLGNVCASGTAGMSAEALCKQAVQLCKTDPEVAKLTYCIILSIGG